MPHCHLIPTSLLGCFALSVGCGCNLYLTINLFVHQPGNPSPRVFRLPEDSGLINRYGFPSLGHTALLSRLRTRLPTFTSPDSDASNTPASLYPHKFLAINLGKNKTSPLESPEDFVTGVKAFAPYADALVVNVSSPNTPGLR